MSHPSSTSINFADTIGVLSSGQVWEYETGARGESRDPPSQVFDALQSPIDFPPLESSIVSGDRVALAVDPNIPGVVDVIQGAIKALGLTDADDIDIVLGDEATVDTLEAIKEEVSDAINVVRHSPSDRGSLRYVGADEFADPIYLNRALVDADFVLPMVAGRPLDTACAHDLTGIFPAFADSRTRRRHRQRSIAAAPTRGDAADPSEMAWLLGVQIMVSVTASDRGSVGQIIAGTPDSIRKQLTPSRRLPDEFPPAAPLLIASLDGDAQQQSWCNAARAVAAASRYAQPGATIILWSAISEPPTGRLLNLTDDESTSTAEDALEEEDFPAWDESTGSAQTLARIASEHRLLIHSRLDDDTIESMGLASVESHDELARLSGSFEACGVLRAAQFAGTTIDMPIQFA